MKSNILNLSILGVILQSKGENQQHESSPLPFFPSSLSPIPYPLPLSTPATQATRVTHILCRLQDTTSRSKCTTLALSKMKGPENSFVIPPKISQLRRVLKLNENV